MDQDQRIAELERRLSEYERARRTQPTIRVGSRRLRRGIAIAAVAMAIVVLPGVVLASHIFTDVPDSHTFHDEIGNLYDARITTGCSPTTYCPENTVTRGQMAGFLNRGLGRAGSSLFQDTVPSPAANLDGSHTVKVGTVTGGTAQVKIDASVSAFLDDFTGCPCRAVFWLTSSAGPTTVANYALQFRGLIGAFDWQSMSMSHVFTVPTGVNVTFSVRAQMAAGTGDIIAYGTISSISAPFGATGGAPETVAAPTSPEDPTVPGAR